jgi:hypothetical protein
MNSSIEDFEIHRRVNFSSFVIPVKTGIQACPCEHRELNEHGFLLSQE